MYKTTSFRLQNFAVIQLVALSMQMFAHRHAREKHSSERIRRWHFLSGPQGRFRLNINFFRLVKRRQFLNFKIVWKENVQM